MRIVIASLPVFDIINYEIKLIPLNQAVSSTLTKSKDKNLNILTMKRAFTIKQNIFFIIFKVLSLEELKQTNSILEGESPTLSNSYVTNQP